MYTKWTSNLRNAEDREAFKGQVLSSKHVLERLVELLTADLQDLNNIEVSEGVFSDPNWAYKQAYYNGRKAELNNVIKLINLDKQETK